MYKHARYAAGEGGSKSADSMWKHCTNVNISNKRFAQRLGMGPSFSLLIVDKYKRHLEAAKYDRELSAKLLNLYGARLKNGKMWTAETVELMLRRANGVLKKKGADLNLPF